MSASIDRYARTEKFRERMKTLLGFLTALALTNAVSKLNFDLYLVDATTNRILTYPLWHFFHDSSQLLCFLIAIILILRFFFGNVGHIESDRDGDYFELVVDSMVSILQILLLAYSTFFINIPSKFFAVVILLFFIEICWAIPRALYSEFLKKFFTDPSIDRFTVKDYLNQLNSFVLLSVLVLFGFSFDSTPFSDFIRRTASGDFRIENYACIGIFSINTIFDIFLNWRKYIYQGSLPSAVSG